MTGTEHAFKDGIDLDEVFEFIVKLVKNVASNAVKMNDLSARLSTQKLHRKDLVTTTDKDVEKQLVEGILERYPNHKFISEESFENYVILTDEPTWIIDPIDGTTNFVHKFPYFCISIALYVGKESQIGIIHNPALNQCYTAQRGLGARMNDVPILISGQTQLSESLVLSELGSGVYQDRLSTVLENKKILIRFVHGLRSIGSAAMDCCFVADGSVDAYYQYGIHLWDVAAGALIITEAGGIVIDPAGGPFDLMSRRILAAATPELADQMVAILKQSYPKKRDDEPGGSMEEIDDGTRELSQILITKKTSLCDCSK